jgi:phenylalanyl-tRNA synthetase beta chain
VGGGRAPAGDAIPGFSVEVQAPDLCPRFTARLFEDVKLGPSPLWLKARLMAAGQRPISNVVDITNYVMLLTGQPMHAFDADLVAGGTLVVRRARDGETMTTLDDVERTLDAEMCVIDDAEGPTSIAGVMGGARSEVRDSTTRVLMEAATWNGPNIQRTSTRLGLRTEASGRFEKQLQPEQGIDGQAVATKLMIELCGARPVGGTIDVGGPGPDPVTIRLRDGRTERLLGVAVPRAEAHRILGGLGFGVAEVDDGLDVTVPPWRRDDVFREADLIEEVARIWGLDRIPATLPSRRGAVGRLAPEQRLRRRLEDALRGTGLSEAVGWSFTSRETAARLGLPAGGAVELENPMSEEQSVMRRRCSARCSTRCAATARAGFEDVRCSSTARSTCPAAPTRRPATPGTRARPGAPAERTHLGALLTGRLRPRLARAASRRRPDFFAAKGVLEALLRALRVDWPSEPAREPFLHPGRAARVRARGDGRAGWLGELHPRSPPRWDLDGPCGFELDSGVLVAAARRCSATRTSRRSRRPPGPRGGRRDDVPAARVLASCAARRRAAARGRGVRRLPRRPGRRGARVARACGSSSARRTAR